MRRYTRMQVVSQQEEHMAVDPECLVLERCRVAYRSVRRECPTGDLQITFSREADSETEKAECSNTGRAQ